MKVIQLVFVLLLCSCSALAPSSDEIAKADYGREPTVTEMETAAKLYMSSRLRDPYSAVWSEWSPFEAGYQTNPLILGGGVKWWGWWATVAINAKNTFGGYTGLQGYRFLYRDGYIRAHCELSNGQWFCAAT